MEKVEQVARVHAEAVRIAQRSGLTLLAGTDSIFPHMHGRNYMEVVSLVKDGLTPLAAWYSGTGLAAERIEQRDTGKLLPGYRADLLLCTDDVIAAPHLLDEGVLAEVVKDGVGYRGYLNGLPQKTFRSGVRELLATPPSD